MWLKVGVQAFFDLRVHFRRFGGVELLVLFLFFFDAYAWQVYKIERLLQCGGWIGVEILTFEDQYLLSGKQVHPNFELIDIDAPGEIRVMAMIVPDLLFITCQFFGFFPDAIFLAVDSFCEREFFVAAVDLVVVV